MTANILEGQRLAEEIFTELRKKVSALPSSALKPKLAIVQILGDEASNIYVKHKLKALAKIGMEGLHVALPKTTSPLELQLTLEKLTQDPSVHGILLQLPLPPTFSSFNFLRFIDPSKDVDGLTTYNQGCLMQKQPHLVPCTPAGIIRLLEHYKIPMKGQEMVILNASSLVGRPLALLALDRGATVTLCNSKTQKLQEKVKRADILVSATGHPHLIPSEWLKKDGVVVDVGVHRTEKGLVGDVDFETARQVAGWITPVPGGVGPMTVAMLMENLWAAYNRAL